MARGLCKTRVQPTRCDKSPQAMLFRDFFFPGVPSSPALFFLPSSMPPVLFLPLAAVFSEPRSPPRMPVTIRGMSFGCNGFPFAASTTLNARLLRMPKDGGQGAECAGRVPQREDFAVACCRSE